MTVTPPNQQQQYGETLKEFTHHDLVLQKHRICTLFGEINEETGSNLLKQLLASYKQGESLAMERVETEDGEFLYKGVPEVEPINLYLNSPGGQVTEAFAIVDNMSLIQGNGGEIATFGTGIVASAAVLILAAGSPGLRQATANCRIMLHDVSMVNFGKYHEIQTQVEELTQLRLSMKDKLLDLTGMTEERYDEIMNRKDDFWFNAEEAVELGIIDEVV